VKVLCSGFFGHGNIGDEAIARAMARYLVEPFENVELQFSTEMSYTDAQEASKDSRFYRDHKLISSFDVEAAKEADLCITGGGDLSITYCLSQTMLAAASGRTRLIARIGTSANNEFLSGGAAAVEVVKSVLKLYNHLSVRDPMSFGVVGSLGAKAHLGSDLAMDLPCAGDGPRPDGEYAVAVIREVRKGDADRQTKMALAAIGALQREFPKVVLLPFCKNDFLFARHLDEQTPDDVTVVPYNNNPGQVASVIADAKYVLSVGRLHALVFAIGNRVPAFAVSYPWINGYDKISAFMQSAALGSRVADWGLPPAEVAAKAHDAIRSREGDLETINVYSGHLKGLMLESLCPVWQAMEASHGLGLERGLKAGEFRPDDYDDSYYFGARVFKAGNEFRIYHPTRGDWEGWRIIRDLIMDTMSPKSIMDAGCGRGWFVRHCRERKIEAEGIDCSYAAWKTAAPGVQQHLKVGTLADLSHRQYDVLTVFDVMEHVFEPDVVDIIATLKEAAGKHIVFNICAAKDDEPEYTIKANEPVPAELEWLAVSGHVTIRHRAWWKAKFEDDHWYSNEALVDQWFSHPGFEFPSWQRHNIIILSRREAG